MCGIMRILFVSLGDGSGNPTLIQDVVFYCIVFLVIWWIIQEVRKVRRQ